MSAPQEIELKLECSVLDLAALAAHPLLAVATGASDPVLTVSTYFDTEAGDLQARGVTLRVRRSGERFVQTVKQGRSGGALSDRTEWERDVAGDALDAGAYADTPVPDILADATDPTLHRRFQTVVMRTTRPVGYGSSRIEAVLDEGRVETPAGDATLCELELELLSGEAGDLLALAQVLAETVPLRLGVASKSERGFALLAGRGRRPGKAAPVALAPDCSAGTAFHAVARACLRHLRLNEDVYLAVRDPEALHQMRVALRRLRSAFSLFGAVLAGDPRATPFADEIKRVTEPFGRARNLDVFLAETLPAEVARRPDEPGLDALRVRLEQDREQAHAGVRAVLESGAWRGLLLDLAAWIECGAWRGGEAARDTPADTLAATVLGRYRRRIRKRGRRLERLDPETRHRVRIAAKKLRYGSEFFAGLYPGKKQRRRHRSFTAALSDLQDHLGALNDLATAHAMTASLAQEGAPGPALFAAGLTAADEESATRDLLAKAARAHAALCDLKPFWR